MKNLAIPLISFALMSATLPLNALAREGHGVGTGNGDERIVFAEKELADLPAQEELNAIFLAIARELPTLSRRLGEMNRRFSQDPAYLAIHLQGSYPYQRANSRNSTERGPEGLPKSARLAVWDEFMASEPIEQAWVLIHEMLHFLVTGDDEARTARATATLRALVESPDLDARAHALDELMLELREQVELRAAEFSEALRAYREAMSLAVPCADLVPGPLAELGLDRIAFRLPPPGFSKRLANDRFFELYRQACLSATTEGKMILGDVFAHPLVQALWASRILGRPLDLRLRSAPDEVNPATPSANDAAAFLPRLAQIIRARRAFTVDTLPAHAEWLKARDAWFLPSERKAEIFVSTSAWTSFPERWVRFLSSRVTRFELSAAQWKGWPVRLLPGTNESGSCAVGTTLECAYRIERFWGLRRKTVRREWTITRDWGVSVLMRSGVDYNAWPALRFTAR